MSRRKKMQRKNRPAHTRRNRRLTSEMLEDRRLLAGDFNDAFGDQIRTYRLAISATAEWTAAADATTPDIPNDGQTRGLEIVQKLVDDINEVYRRDAAIQFNLVTGTNTLFTDPATDGLTNAIGTAIDENTGVLNAAIGVDNYDIGHVFVSVDGEGGGGVAGQGVGNATRKGQGATEVSTTNPSPGVLFHEIGHQFGAPHTFQSNYQHETGISCRGNRSSSGAYEPGGGLTIMSYAGICGLDNLPFPSIPYFHSSSIEFYSNMIAGRIAGGEGVPSGNMPNDNNVVPIVDATPNDNVMPTNTTSASATNNMSAPTYLIPTGTPFELTALGSDGNGDDLTYSWEQLDLGQLTDLPADGRDLPLRGDVATGPLFRALPPSANVSRSFPDLADLAAGVDTRPKGEVLPTVPRDLNFRAIVRDGRGGVNSDDIKLRVVDTGAPFAITSWNSPTTLTGGSTESIQWNVAGTGFGTEINAIQVDISMSTDGGLTYPTSLGRFANTGSADIIVPNYTVGDVRFRIQAHNNVFFDITDTNVSIQADPTRPGITITESDGRTAVAEPRTVGHSLEDSYQLQLNTVPSGPVTIEIVAAEGTYVSTIGDFSSSRMVTLSNTDPITVTVKAADDTENEGIKSGLITHRVVADSAPYPLTMNLPSLNVTLIDDEMPPLIGVDFDQENGESPPNWTLSTEVSDETLTNLIREDGQTTNVGLIRTIPDGSFRGGGGGPDTIEVQPLHSTPLDKVGGVRTNGTAQDLTWTGLVPGRFYNVYVLLIETFPSNSYTQTVTVTGANGPQSFMMDSSGANDGKLLINSQLAQAGRPMEADAIVAVADSNGNIRIRVDQANDTGISAVAIQPTSTLNANYALTLDTAKINEAGGTATATLTRVDTSSAESVMLRSEDTSEATVPASISFAAGESSKTFPVTAVDDTIIDFEKSAFIVASVDVAGQPTDIARTAVLVDDDDALPIIGVDFEFQDDPDKTPPNWTKAHHFDAQNLTNLMYDDGSASAISLTTPSSTGAWFSSAPSTVPIHTPSIAEVAVYRSAPSQSLVWSGLTPGKEYNTYLFLIENRTEDTFNQRVTLTGEGAPQIFTMSSDGSNQDKLLVNDKVAAADRLLEDEAVKVTANGNGEIRIQVDPVSGPTVGISGLAIQEVKVNQPSLTLQPTSTSISEDGGVATMTITRPDGTGAQIVNLNSSDTSEATVPNTVEFADGQTTTTFEVTAVDDGMMDGDQTVTITASAEGFNAASATVTVTDRVVVPTLTVALTNSSIAENGTTMATVTMSANALSDTEITLTSSDTGEATVTPATVTIPAGQSVATFTINGVADGEVDGTQMVTLTATSPNLVDATQTLTVTDVDVEVPTMTLALTDSSIAENGTTMATITLSANVQADTEITLVSSDTGEATVTPATVTIPAGQSVANFTINGVADGEVDGTQTVTLTATSPNLVDATQTLTVTDVDVEVPTMTLALTDSSIAENGTTMATITLSANVQADTEITLVSSDTGEATVTPATVTIPAGQSVATFTINGVADGEVDGTKMVTLTATSPNLVDATQTLTVTDVDIEVPTMTLALTDSSIAENGTTMATITLSANVQADTEITLVSSDTGEAAVATQTMTVPAGQTTATFTVNGVADGEVDGTQTVTLTASSNGLVDATATLDVTDVDAETPTMMVALNDTMIAENGTTTATVTLSAAAAADTEITLTSSDETEATVGTATATIVAGESSATFTINGVLDAQVDGTQTVTLTASAGGYEDVNAMLEVTDVDVPALQLNLSTTIIAEDGSATASISLSSAVDADTTILVSSGDTTEATVAPAMVTIPAGETMATAIVTITGVQDGEVDGNQEIQISASAVEIGTATTSFFTVIDIDTLPGDFDNDGNLDLTDIDALVGQIAVGDNNIIFDLTGDGQVDLADRDEWLRLAGARNLPSGNAYLIGDANLDGMVDETDRDQLLDNIFSETAAWSAGDFNADGGIDVSDFNLWNENKFRDNNASNRAVTPALEDATDRDQKERERKPRAVMDRVFAAMGR